MPLTVSDILHNADLFRRAYPGWPHPEPEEKAVTPATPRISRGSLLRLPDGRTAVAETVSDDGEWFRSTGGQAYLTREAQVVPLSPETRTEAAA
jgi:hypothetical protein